MIEHTESYSYLLHYGCVRWYFFRLFQSCPSLSLWPTLSPSSALCWLAGYWVKSLEANVSHNMFPCCYAHTVIFSHIDSNKDNIPGLWWMLPSNIRQSIYLESWGSHLGSNEHLIPFWAFLFFFSLLMLTCFVFLSCPPTPLQRLLWECSSPWLASLCAW